MSFSTGSKEQTTNQNQTAVSDPWKQAQDDVKRFLGNLDKASKGKGPFKPNANEMAAIDELRNDDRSAGANTRLDDDDGVQAFRQAVRPSGAATEKLEERACRTRSTLSHRRNRQSRDD